MSNISSEGEACRILSRGCWRSVECESSMSQLFVSCTWQPFACQLKPPTGHTTYASISCHPHLDVPFTSLVTRVFWPGLHPSDKSFGCQSTPSCRHPSPSFHVRLLSLCLARVALASRTRPDYANIPTRNSAMLFILFQRRVRLSEHKTQGRDAQFTLLL